MMGGLNSKTFEEISKHETPTHPKKIVRQEFDPRSPSTNVSRTPIHVDRSLEPVIDPRSPNVSIDRTPIMEPVRDRTPFSDITNSEHRIETQLEDKFRSVENSIIGESFESSGQQLFATAKDTFDLGTESGPESGTLNRSASEPSLVSSDDHQLIHQVAAPPVRSKSFREKTMKLLHRRSRGEEKETKFLDKIRESLPDCKQSPYMKVKDVTPENKPVRDDGFSPKDKRSPLGSANRKDVNSPRAIVQRKQVKGLEWRQKLRQNKHGYQSFEHDKENSDQY